MSEFSLYEDATASMRQTPIFRSTVTARGKLDQPEPVSARSLDQLVDARAAGLTGARAAFGSSVGPCGTRVTSPDGIGTNFVRG